MPAAKYLSVDELSHVSDWQLSKRLDGAVERGAIMGEKANSISFITDDQKRRAAMERVVYAAQRWKHRRALPANTMGSSATTRIDRLDLQVKAMRKLLMAGARKNYRRYIASIRSFIQSEVKKLCGAA